MTDSQFQLLHRELQGLHALVKELLEPRPSRAGDELLSLEAAAAILRVAPSTLRRGKAGTRVIPRQSARPVLFLRRDVEEFVRARAERRRKGRKPDLRLVQRRGKRAS